MKKKKLDSRKIQRIAEVVRIAIDSYTYPNPPIRTFKTSLAYFVAKMVVKSLVPGITLKKIKDAAFAARAHPPIELMERLPVVEHVTKNMVEAMAKDIDKKLTPTKIKIRNIKFDEFELKPGE